MDSLGKDKRDSGDSIDISWRNNIGCISSTLFLHRNNVRDGRFEKEHGQREICVSRAADCGHCWRWFVSECGRWSARESNCAGSAASSGSSAVYDWVAYCLREERVELGEGGGAGCGETGGVADGKPVWWAEALAYTGR